MMPMMSMPFMGMPNQQINPEQMAQMQRLALQNQQLQLKQMKQMLEQSIQSIDAALGQLDEQFERIEKGEVPAVQAQIQAQGLIQQLQPQSYLLRARLSDPRLFDPRVDPQNWVMGGMGDFGRPIF